MKSCNGSICPPEEKKDTNGSIPFPFEHPYPQQVQLMKAIVSTIQKGNVGLFESPTGTGKSMSVICSVVHWLQAEERRIVHDISSVGISTATAVTTSSSTGIDWLDDFIISNSEDQEKGRKRQAALAVRAVLLERIARKKTLNILPLHHRGRGRNKRHPEKSEAEDKVDHSCSGAGGASGEREESEDVLSHYNSDDDATISDAKVQVGYDSDSDTESRAARALLEAKDIPLDDKRKLDLEPLIAQVDDQLHMPKIYYCSRTHSQLAQFISEIKKATGGGASSIRCITLGSRSNMCINPEVNKLSSDAAISEKCLDMQKSRPKSSTVKRSESDNSGSSNHQRIVSAAVESGTNGGSCKCEFHSVVAEQHFMEHALGAVRDIEDLVLLGSAVQACPYYASRRALGQAQVVCLPYNLMLSKQSRAALGITLEHNVVIFDEAHNIVEAANMVHSAQVSGEQLSTTLLALKMYLSRFRHVLNGKNFFYLNLLISMVQSFLKLATTPSQDKCKEGCAEATPAAKNRRPGAAHTSSSAVYTVNDFVFLSSTDNVNMRKVARYTEATQLVRKVGGYVDNEVKKARDLAKEEELLSQGKASGTEKEKKRKRQAQSSESKPAAIPPPLLLRGSSATHSLRLFFGLLDALQNSDADGRIFVQGSVASGAVVESGGGSDTYLKDCSIQYVLLNPANHFSDIVAQSRSVLCLGGTLQPFDYILASLFPECTLSSSKLGGPSSAPAGPVKVVDTFSCSHIVPSSHISTYAVRSGPSNVLLDFRHGSREKDELVRELFRTVLHICQVVPHGVVLFFTSYAYMGLVVAAWKRMLLMPELGAIKHICVEQRRATPPGGEGGNNDNNDGERARSRARATAREGFDPGADAWGKYCSCVRDSTNHASSKGALLFSVMGGKLSEGINFSDDLARAVVIVGMPYPDLADPVLKEKLSFAERAKAGSSRAIYEGMCMKSVNQSIGRAIRHIGDYASVVLLDSRYTLPRVRGQLPGWILKSAPNNTTHSSGGQQQQQQQEIFHTFPMFQDTVSNIKNFFACK